MKTFIILSSLLVITIAGCIHQSVDAYKQYRKYSPEILTERNTGKLQQSTQPPAQGMVGKEYNYIPYPILPQVPRIIRDLPHEEIVLVLTPAQLTPPTKPMTIPDNNKFVYPRHLYNYHNYHKPLLQNYYTKNPQLNQYYQNYMIPNNKNMATFHYNQPNPGFPPSVIKLRNFPDFINQLQHTGLIRHEPTDELFSGLDVRRKSGFLPDKDDEIPDDESRDDKDDKIPDDESLDDNDDKIPDDDSDDHNDDKIPDDDSHDHNDDTNSDDDSRDDNVDPDDKSNSNDKDDESSEMPGMGMLNPDINKALELLLHKHDLEKGDDDDENPSDSSTAANEPSKIFNELMTTSIPDTPSQSSSELPEMRKNKLFRKSASEPKSITEKVLEISTETILMPQRKIPLEYNPQSAKLDTFMPERKSNDITTDTPEIHTTRIQIVNDTTFIYHDTESSETKLTTTMIPETTNDLISTTDNPATADQGAIKSRKQAEPEGTTTVPSESSTDVESETTENPNTDTTQTSTTLSDNSESSTTDSSDLDDTSDTTEQDDTETQSTTENSQNDKEPGATTTSEINKKQPQTFFASDGTEKYQSDKTKNISQNRAPNFLDETNENDITVLLSSETAPTPTTPIPQIKNPTTFATLDSSAREIQLLDPKILAGRKATNTIVFTDNLAGKMTTPSLKNIPKAFVETQETNNLHSNCRPLKVMDSSTLWEQLMHKKKNVKPYKPHFPTNLKRKIQIVFPVKALYKIISDVYRQAKKPDGHKQTGNTHEKLKNSNYVPKIKKKKCDCSLKDMTLLQGAVRSLQMFASSLLSLLQQHIGPKIMQQLFEDADVYKNRVKYV